MDGYAKVWLQFVFPLYILFLVAIVISTATYFPQFAKLLSNRNPIATLATLILLSYAKLLRTVIAALSFATLEYHTSDGEVRTVIVWLVDANVRYFQGKHIPLFIAGLLVLLVGLTYTFFLFSWQWIQHCPNRWSLGWIRNVKLNSYIDAYHAPYNRHHRYWTGLLLLVRAVLYLIAALNVVGDPRNTLLSIACVVGSLLLLKELAKDRVYKKWPLNALESSFIFNLVIFATATLYAKETGGNQAALAYTSTLIAFVTFLAILAYHCFSNFKPLQKMADKIRARMQRDTTKGETQLESVNAAFEQSAEFSRLREPLFDNDDVISDENYIIEQSTYKAPDTSSGVTHSVVEAIPTETNIAMETL